VCVCVCVCVASLFTNGPVFMVRLRNPALNNYFHPILSSVCKK
jgi:hypothetical protein